MIASVDVFISLPEKLQSDELDSDCCAKLCNYLQFSERDCNELNDNVNPFVSDELFLSDK
jgi:hypothetical protein